MGLRNLLGAAWVFLRTEYENVRRYDVPWRRRLWLYRHGYLSSRDSIRDVDDRTVEESLCDLEDRLATEPLVVKPVTAAKGTGSGFST